MITPEEIALARHAIDHSLALGAQKVRVTLNKSLMELVGTLDGQIDKVSHCLDRSLTIALFVEGRYGSFSINRMEEAVLDAFLERAVDTVRMLASDACRDLPDPARKATDAVTGEELGLYDPAYPSLDIPRRREMALGAPAKRPESPILPSFPKRASIPIPSSTRWSSTPRDCSAGIARRPLNMGWK